MEHPDNKNATNNRGPVASAVHDLHLERPLCPKCGEEARGTLETVEGVALIVIEEGSDTAAGPAAPCGADYEGYTEIAWDTQTTNEPLTLVCHCGNLWHDDGSPMDQAETPRAERDRINLIAGSVDVTDGEPGTQLYWSNVTGWGSIGGADMFTDDERSRTNLPIGGRWVRFEAQP